MTCDFCDNRFNFDCEYEKVTLEKVSAKIQFFYSKLQDISDKVELKKEDAEYLKDSYETLFSMILHFD